MNVVSFSGGKDSTAMLLAMLERKEPIHSVVAFDTGWEFPAMIEHWDAVEKYTGIKIVRLRPEQPFDYWLFDRPIVAKKGPMKGQVHRYGNGWPSWTRRWCTREKVNSIKRYLKTIKNPVLCIGFAADEKHRTVGRDRKIPERYPLIEWNITEADALALCKKHGFNWGGLYDHFSRVSCFCCPLQRIGELRKLRKHFSELWWQMIEWDNRSPEHNKGFRGYESVADLEERFSCEDRGEKYTYKNRRSKEIPKEEFLRSASCLRAEADSLIQSAIIAEELAKEAEHHE